METTRAILLRKVRYGESSLVITWLSENCGKLKTAARGALRPGSTIGRLDLFYEVELLHVPPRRGELHAIREAHVLEIHDGLRRDYARILLCSYFAELLEACVPAQQPAAGVFDLMQRALRHVSSEGASLRAMRHFEKQLCAALGIHDEKAAPGDHYRALTTFSGVRSRTRDSLLKQLG